MAEELGKANAPQEQQPGKLSLQEQQPGGAEAAQKKKTWPELVGSTAEGAEKKIKEEIGDSIRVQVVSPNTFVTMDFDQQRVRLYVDSSGNIARTPRIG